MDFLDDLRAREVEHFGDVFVTQPIALKIKRARLEICAHRPIEDDDPSAHQLKKRQSHWLLFLQKRLRKVQQ